MKLIDNKRSNIRFFVWERDDWICHYCGANLWMAYALWKRYCVFGSRFGLKIKAHFRPTVDHVIPKSKGGEYSVKNLVTSCCECNNKRGDTDKAIFEAIIKEGI